MREQERFWPKVDKDGPNGCWIWTAARSPLGYGKFRVGGRAGATVQAHRFAFETAFGPVSRRLDLDHLCRNQPCVNPAHLQAVSHAENMRRYAETRTHCVQGHPYDPGSFYVKADNSRACRECNKARCRARWLRKKTAV